MDRKIVSALTTIYEEQIALLQKNVKILKELQVTVVSTPIIKPVPAKIAPTVVVVDEKPAVAEEKEKVSKKKPKKIVDPNKPKRPLTGYQLYMADNNTSIKENNPDASATLIMTLLAKGWSTLQPDVKDKYMKKGEQLREIYQAELVAYLSKGGQVADIVTVSNETSSVPVEKIPKKPKVSKQVPIVPITTSSSNDKVVSPIPIPVVPIPVVVPVVEDSEKKKKKKKRTDESTNDSENQATEADKKKKKKHNKKDE